MMLKTQLTMFEITHVNYSRAARYLTDYISEWWGWSPDRIASEFNISLSQVHAALAYYFDNIDEIRDEMQRELERYQEAKASSPSLIAQKLSRQETQSA